MKRILLLALFLAAAASGRKFYPDDPVARMPDPLRVEDARPRKLNDYYDFFQLTFFKVGERQKPGKPVPAQAVNTLGEVPDSSWYTNRHGSKRLSRRELVRGPGEDNAPDAGPWEVTEAKNEGVTPGFTIRDARGNRYKLKFDPLSNPEMATAADVIGSKFFHALGYNVPENYLVTFPRERLVLRKGGVEFIDAFGKRRRMTGRDVDEILLKVPRTADGRLRGVASYYLRGKLLREFRFHGARKDDPNDIVPHEHRRDLRGLFVFCAWLGHDDSRAINTMDAVVEEAGLNYIRHYLIDFGSILGSASTKPNSPRSGNEYLFSWRPAAMELFTLGLYVPRWARARYPHLPSVGLFESRLFDPERYHTEYPNPAFNNRLPDDTYWAAKKVMAFSDGDIRAIVETGEYSDPRAREWVAECLIERRDKIGRTYFDKVLPLDHFRVEDERLHFEDLAAAYGFREAAKLSVAWSRFDNETEARTPLAGSGFRLPDAALAASAGEYFAADIHSENPGRSVRVYLRRTPAGFEIAGIDRTW